MAKDNWGIICDSVKCLDSVCWIRNAAAVRSFKRRRRNSAARVNRDASRLPDKEQIVLVKNNTANGSLLHSLARQFSTRLVFLVFWASVDLEHDVAKSRVDRPTYSNVDQ